MLVAKNLDFNHIEHFNGRIQNLAAAPSSPAEGWYYFDTVLHAFGVYQNGAWAYLAAAATNTVSKTANASAGSVLQVSGAADKSIADFTSAGGIVKVSTTGVVTLAVAGTDYSTPAATESLTNKALVDNSTSIVDNTDATKKILFDAAGTTGTSTTLTSSQTTNKVLTLPDATDTLVGKATTDTLTNKTLSSPVIATITNTGTLTLPTSTDTLVGKATTDTFTNKTFNAAGTGNVLSNIATSMFAANVVDTDGTLTANSDTRLASQKAVVTYVQANVQGLSWKFNARLATTGAETYTITAGAVTQITGTSVDGVTGAIGDRIVIKNAPSATGAGAGAGTANTTQPANGIYIVTNATTNLTVQRAVDADTAAEIKGSIVDVLEGTANADQAFNMITDGTITLNTTGLTFTDFVKANVPSASTSVQGKVFLATQAEAEAKSDSTKAIVAADLANFPIKKTATIGDGSTTSIVVTDNLPIDKIAECRDASTNAAILCDKTYAANTTTFIFAVAPASNAYKVVIIG